MHHNFSEGALRHRLVGVVNLCGTEHLAMKQWAKLARFGQLAGARNILP
jgi:hypothetical protein